MSSALAWGAVGSSSRSSIPEATRDSGRVAGLVTTLGFAVATALSSIA